MPTDGYVADDLSQRYSGHRGLLCPNTENSCVDTTVGSLLCEVQAAPTHTNWRVEREMSRKSKGLFEEVLSIDCPIIFALTTQHKTACLHDQTYHPDIIKEDFPGVRVFSQIENI